MSYVLFDIGGTKTRVAMTDDCQKFSEPVSFDTPKKYKDGVAALTKAIDDLGITHIRGMAGGVRGVLNEDKTAIANDSALADWVDEPLVETLHKKYKTAVQIENDAAIVGLGESHFGAGQGAEIVAYLTVSTGVGGAKIEDGIIDDASIGFEPGKQILDVDRTILGDDVVPTLEHLISGTALEGRTGIKPYDIPQSDAVWDQLAEYLSHGLRNTILYWSPDVIVLGGSMIIGDPRILLDDIIKHTNEALDDELPCPLIKDAELGAYGGLYGAIALLDQEV